MKQRLKSNLQSGYGQLLWAAISTSLILSVIVWASLTVGHRTCGANVGINFASSSECPSFLEDLEPLAIALCFWIIGLVVWIASRRNLALGFFLMTAGTIAAGKVSAMNIDWGTRLFYVLLAWLSPVTLHFHFTLLDRTTARTDRIILGIFYSLAFILSLPSLLLTAGNLAQHSLFGLLREGVRLNLVLSILLTGLLLLKDYRSRASPAARYRIRLITFGTILAVLPLLFLCLLPDTLGAPYHLPYEFTFPWLLLSPLSYVYSLFRRQLIRAEFTLNRAAIFYVLAIVLLGIYLITIAALNRFTSNLTQDWTLICTLLTVGLVLLVPPLQRILRHLMAWVLYGRGINYAHVVGHLAESLSATLDRDLLQRRLVDELASVMHLSRIALFLRDQENTLNLVRVIGFARSDFAPGRLSVESQLVAYLKMTGKPMENDRVHSALAKIRSQGEERMLLAQNQVAFWVPLLSSNILQGLILIGPREDNDLFTLQDNRILQTLVHQAGIAAQNVHLMEQVRLGREELARAHQQLLVAHEKEQRRLAAELHDGVVQQMLGINYQLAEIQRQAGNGLSHTTQEIEGLRMSLGRSQQELLKAVAQLRSLIHELRPAGLEEVGLTDALAGYVATLEREARSPLPEITLALDQIGTTLPKPAAICLFRVAQEALRNALSHARARRIHLSLHLAAEKAILDVCDDGCGFYMPVRLSEFAQTNHFGLVGIAERVTWAGGQLTVHSQPGNGTTVTAWIPYKEMQK